VIQKKIPQHESCDIYEAEQYFILNFPFLFSIYFFTTLPNFAPFTYLTFGEMMQHQSQYKIFSNQQLNVSNFA